MWTPKKELDEWKQLLSSDNLIKVKEKIKTSWKENPKKAFMQFFWGALTMGVLMFCLVFFIYTPQVCTGRVYNADYFEKTAWQMYWSMGSSYVIVSPECIGNPVMCPKYNEKALQLEFITCEINIKRGFDLTFGRVEPLY